MTFDVASAFTWSPNGKFIAYVADNSVFVSEVASGKSFRLTTRSDDAVAPRPQACVFAPTESESHSFGPLKMAGDSGIRSLS